MNRRLGPAARGVCFHLGRPEAELDPKLFERGTEALERLETALGAGFPAKDFARLLRKRPGG